MDHDRNRLERLRLPESLTVSGDPVEGNPYPIEHPAHRVWMNATREAEMEVSRINSEAPSTLTPANADAWMPALAVLKFDVWARRGVHVVWTDDAVQQYDGWLVGYANAWIESIAQLLTSRVPPFPPERALVDLRRRLAARVLHWKAEARRFRVQLEALAAEAALEIPRPPGEKLIERRRRAVQKYRDDHDLNAVGFARRVGVSESAIRAIVRGDTTRFKSAAQEKVLNAIGMTREEWYRE